MLLDTGICCGVRRQGRFIDQWRFAEPVGDGHPAASVDPEGARSRRRRGSGRLRRPGYAPSHRRRHGEPGRHRAKHRAADHGNQAATGWYRISNRSSVTCPSACEESAVQRVPASALRRVHGFAVAAFQPYRCRLNRRLNMWPDGVCVQIRHGLVHASIVSWEAFPRLCHLGAGHRLYSSTRYAR
jgi:hypothetical protein